MTENITENYLERRKSPCSDDTKFGACPMYNSHVLSEEQIVFITTKTVELIKIDLIRETKDYIDDKIDDKIDDSIPQTAEKVTKQVIENICIGAGKSLGRTIRDKLFLVLGVIVLSYATGISIPAAWGKLKDTLM